MKYVMHTFGPNETIDAIVLLKNRHNLNDAEALDMRSWYNVLNNSEVPHQGDIKKIPVLDRHTQHYTLEELGQV